MFQIEFLPEDQRQYDATLADGKIKEKIFEAELTIVVKFGVWAVFCSN